MRRDRGFTLIELLLALAIFSVVSLSIYAAFAIGVKLSGRSDQDQDLFQQTRWTFDLMSRELENAVMFDTGGSYPEQSVFKGEVDNITFLTVAGGALKVVRYYLSAPDEGEIFKTVIGKTYQKNVDMVTRYEENFEVEYLIREEQSLMDFLNEQGEPEKEILSSNISPDGLRFFYGYNESAQPEGPASVTWKSDWESTQIPSHVKIEIDFLSASPGQEKFSLTNMVLIPDGFLGEI